MELGKYKLAMRPKKYLTREFVVYKAAPEAMDDVIEENPPYEAVMPSGTPPMDNYMPEIPGMEDPSLQQIELADGGVVQREGFGKGSVPPGYITGKELEELTGIPNLSVKAKELMYAPKEYKRQKNLFGDFYKKQLKAKYFDIGQGGKYGTLHYKKPTAEQIEIMKEYHLRKGAKYGVSKATADRMKLFHNDPKLRNYVRNGKLIPDELLKQYGITRNEAAQSIFRLAQAYNGKNFANVDVGIPKNKSAGKKLFDQIDRAPFGNPYKMVAYKEALNVITDGIGDKYFETTNFENMKREARRILQKEKIPVFDPTIKGSKGINVNELTGVTASSKNKSFPYSQFINLMEGNLNTKAYAGFNKQFEKYEKNLQNEIAKGNKGNPNKIIKEYKNYTKDFLGGLEDIDKAQIEKLGLPELSLKEPTELYGKKRTAELLSQGLDLPASYKELKYSIKVPKGTATLKEFISDKNIRDKIISELNPIEKEVISKFGKKVSMASGLDPTDVLKMIPEKEYQIMKGAMSKVGNLAKMGARGAQELLLGTNPLGIGITAALTVPFMVADLAEGKRFSEALQNQASALTFGLVPEADKRIIEEIGGPEAGVGFEIQQNIDKLKSLQNDLREAESKQQEDMMDPEASFAQSSYLDNTRKELQRTFEFLLPYLNERGQIIAPEYNAYLKANNKAQQERTLRKGIGKLEAYDTGFDDISIPEKGPFQQEINKLSKDEEQLEKSYFKKQKQPLQPLGFFGGVDTYKAIPPEELINQYLAYGGRVGLEKGGDPKDKPIVPINPMMDESPQDPSRRTFIQGAGGIGLAGLLLGTGLLKLGKSAAVSSKIGSMVKNTTAPSWMEALITKVMQEGKDLSKKEPGAYIDRYTYSTVSKDKILVKELEFKNPDTGKMETIRLRADEPRDTIYVDYIGDNTLAGQGVTFKLSPKEELVYTKDGKYLTSKKVKGEYEFSAHESEPRVVNWDGDIEFDGETGVRKIIDLNSDISGLKSFVTGGKGVDKKVAKLKKETVDKIEKNPGEYLEDAYDANYYDPSLPTE